MRLFRASRTISQVQKYPNIDGVTYQASSSVLISNIHLTQRRWFAVGLEHSTVAAFVNATHFQDTMCSEDCLDEFIGATHPKCISPSADVPIYNLTKAKEKSQLIYSFTLRLNVPKLLEQTLDLIKQTDAKYIRKRLRVAFKGEEGLDAVG